MLDKAGTAARGAQRSDSSPDVSESLLPREALYLASAAVAMGIVVSRGKFADVAEKALPKVAPIADDLAKTASSAASKTAEVVHEMRTYVAQGFEHPVERAIVKVVEEPFKPGMSRFRVVDHDLFRNGLDDNILAFGNWTKNVENHDVRRNQWGLFRTVSDTMDLFGASQKLKFGQGNKSVYLRPEEFYSRSIENVREALKNVRYKPISHADI